jgi:asparagine synthase (glutamine-hydrolysing)
MDLAAAAGCPWDRDALLATGWLVITRWLARLLHNGDVHAMAFGVEARVPFADAELVERALRVPPRRALEGGVEKRVLRDAVRGLIPEAIRTRRKSALPKDQANVAVLRDAANDAIASSFVREWVDADAIRALTEGQRPCTEAERAALFRVACLGEWADVYGVR